METLINYIYTKATPSSLGLLFGKILLRPRTETRRSSIQVPERAAIGKTLIEIFLLKPEKTNPSSTPKKDSSENQTNSIISTLVASNANIKKEKAFVNNQEKVLNSQVKSTSPTLSAQNSKVEEEKIIQKHKNEERNPSPNPNSIQKNIPTKNSSSNGTPPSDPILPELPNESPKLDQLKASVDQVLLNIEGLNKCLDEAQDFYSLLSIGSDIRDLVAILVDEVEIKEKSGNKIPPQLKNKAFVSPSEQEKEVTLKRTLHQSIDKINNKLQKWKTESFANENQVLKIETLLKMSKEMYFQS